MKRRQFIYSIIGFVTVIGIALTDRIKNHSHVFTKTAPLENSSVHTASPSNPYHKTSHYFTEHQYKTIEQLVSLIIPSENGYGAKEVNLAAYIEQTVALLPESGKIYKIGLSQLDQYCQDSYDRNFLMLTVSEQFDLLDRIFDSIEIHRQRPSGLYDRAKKKIALFWSNKFSVGRQVRFFNQLRRDSMEGFYSHPLSWEMIGYHGPPQPLGYPDYAEAPTIKKLSSSSESTASSTYSQYGGIHDNT